jgi:hypothetical protein
MVGHERTGRLCPQHHFRDLYQKISWPAGSRNPRALWQDGHALQDKRRDWGPGEGNMALSGEDSPEGGLLFPEVRCLEFILENGLPVWRYQALDLVLEKRVLLSQAHRSTRMSFGRSVIVMKYWPKIMGCPNCGSIFMVNRDLSILPEKKTCVCRNQPAISDQSETRQPVKTSRMSLQYFAGAHYAQYEKDDEDNKKDKEKYFCDSGGCSGDTAETKQRCYD